MIRKSCSWRCFIPAEIEYSERYAVDALFELNDGWSCCTPDRIGKQKNVFILDALCLHIVPQECEIS
jgi:hypothetical protein